MLDLRKVLGFEWDEGNINKNEKKHGVSWKECEEAFLQRAYIGDDIKHSKSEKRHYILGSTFQKRKLFVSFTIRKNKIRVISARNQNTKEKNTYINFLRLYEKTN
ncbi:MAG: BrnT family toxin [Candidatus Roizmanbacteria bacterium]|nr:BrnT family toxin [Candidatus Roizmanbacteria bacterium]